MRVEDPTAKISDVENMMLRKGLATLMAPSATSETPWETKMASTMA